MMLSEAIEAYVSYRALQRFAPATVRNDSRVVRQLLEVVGNIQVRNLGPQHVDRWLAVRSDKCQPSTLNVEQQSLRGFEQWMHQRSLISPRVSLTGHLRNHRSMPKQKLVVPASQFGVLLDAATYPTDRIVIALGLYLFPRQSEIASLRIADVSLERGVINLEIHKTRERDVMPICAELEDELRSFFTWRAREYPLRPNQYLACARHVGFTRETAGQRAPGVSLRPDRPQSRPYDAARRVLNAAGFYADNDREGCHVLRRSGATALYQRLKREGHDYAIRTVQAMLHHKSVTTTETYLDISADRKARDDLIKGQRMFPVADNVVSLTRGDDEDVAYGT